MRRSIEKIIMRVSRSIVDCGSEDREVDLDCYVKKIKQFCRNVRSEFNKGIKVAEEMDS